VSLKKTEAIILRYRHFGNTSLIFTVYTKDYGKIDALAKGIKKNISRGEGGTEIFSQVELVYYEKDLRTLRLLNHCYLLDSFKSLRTDLLKFTYASYFIELVDSLVHGEEKNEKIYYLLLNSLHQMENEQDINILVHFFEVKLIGLLGYSHGPIIGGATKHQPRTVSLLQFFEKTDFQTLSRLKISKKDEDQLQIILRNYLRTLLGNGPLRTSAVIEKLTKCKSYY